MYDANIPDWLEGELSDEGKQRILGLCHNRRPDFMLFTEYYDHIPSNFKNYIAWLTGEGTKIGFWQNDPNVFQFRDMPGSHKHDLFQAVDIWFGPYTYSAFVFYPELKGIWPERIWLPNGVGNELQNLPFNENPLPRIFVAGHGDP